MAVTTALVACAPEVPELPRTFQLGALPDSLRLLLSQDCESVTEQHYTGAMAAPFMDQVQIDCHGLEVFGARRKVEFLFNDGPLGHLWVLIDSAESATIDTMLTARFGPVIHATSEYRVYRDGATALRFAPPEVLMATPEVMAELTGYRGGVR